MGKGRSLELYFIDGKPDGMLTAEVFNWTGHVLMIPRTRIKDALSRDEAGYTGVYILLGETEDGPQAYIGEAEELGTRLRGHVKGKDWWEVAVLITSTANNLHKAHVKYLESRLVELALVTKRMPLENSNAPTRSSLSESATANMEEFLDTLMMVLPAIQVDMFVNKVQPKQAVEETSIDTEYPLFEIKKTKNQIHATAELRDGELIVLAGSNTRTIIGKLKDGSFSKKRDRLIDTGILSWDGNKLVFLQSYAFKSPSGASDLVFGYASNGRLEWKLKGTNTTYAEWEAEQLDAKE